MILKWILYPFSSQRFISLTSPLESGKEKKTFGTAWLTGWQRHGILNLSTLETRTHSTASAAYSRPGRNILRLSWASRNSKPKGKGLSGTTAVKRLTARNPIEWQAEQICPARRVRMSAVSFTKGERECPWAAGSVVGLAAIEHQSCNFFYRQLSSQVGSLLLWRPSPVLVNIQRVVAVEILEGKTVNGE